MSTEQVHRNAAIGYNTSLLTDRYEQGRPSYDHPTAYIIISSCLDRVIATYPTEAIHKNNNGNTSSIVIHLLEIGAGTGKFTRVL
jgi:hypothetical protein